MAGTNDKRQKRVAEQIRIVLSELLLFEASDPRLSDIQVMDVEIDRELRYASVYVYALGGADSKDEIMAGLQSAASFLRRELGARISTQHTPELRFVWDETPDRAAHIDSILDSLGKKPDDTEL